MSVHVSLSMEMTDLVGLEPTSNSLPGPDDTQRRWQLVIDPERRVYFYGTADDARSAAAALIALADRLEELDATHQPDPMEDQ